MKPLNLGRRDFLKNIGIGSALLTQHPLLFADELTAARNLSGRSSAVGWPVLKLYDQQHLARIALPLGGIGTGTVSLGGRGDLRDWEIMNRPAKGFVPRGQAPPFFALYLHLPGGKRIVRALEGPLETWDYEGSHGSRAPNHGLPRFRKATFAAAYPFGQVRLSDPDIPVDARIEAFNPMIPGDSDASGLPLAMLRFALHNKTGQPVTASVCGCLPNFIGMDGWEKGRDWKGDPYPRGAKRNRNQFRKGDRIQGLYLFSDGVKPAAPHWGTLALVTSAGAGVSYRTRWPQRGWGGALLDFWDDFSADGEQDEPKSPETDIPMGSLSVKIHLPAHATKKITFVLCWHFPNRYTWTPENNEADRIGNYYTVRFQDAWDAAEKLVPQLPKWEQKTLRFVRMFCESDLPAEVKEAALFNLSTLRTQTCFRTPDRRFYGWEGCSDHQGCCHGSCTHVWNYEQATAFLFGDLAMSMREVEFAHATGDNGMMSFRVALPLERARRFGKAAADGQMGCLIKMYRDWQLSGDDPGLKALWPRVKKALEFCWIPGGWDADHDGVMEGCQHNTMDVEYYGPNPQMGFWYLGALRAVEKMAAHLGDQAFADRCRRRFDQGQRWIDRHLFNGEYYEHQIQMPRDVSEIAPSLRVGMGAKDPTRADFQLGSGCLVDQLVGQFMAHVCGLGHLAKPENIRQTLRGIMKYNLRASLHDHFNNMRSFALGDEKALLMASYPKQRPKFPFPYFLEVMTGFEYTAAVGMLYEGQIEQGLRCIRNIRSRYDGKKRNPFDEAECGHHYARAMSSWAAVLALTGFHYSGVTHSMTVAPNKGNYFWSNGSAWGRYRLAPVPNRDALRLSIAVAHGQLNLRRLVLAGFGFHRFESPTRIRPDKEIQIEIQRTA